MSFSFGFTSEDFEDDVLVDSNGTVQNDNTQADINPLDNPRLLDSEIFQPKVESLEEYLQSLRNVRLTFEKILTPETQTALYRRELFDIKHQLMSENDDGNNELDILLKEDLRKNVYEGGLKSWECSLDLVDSLKTNNAEFQDTVIDLGCGTALPSECIFSQYLENDWAPGLNLILTDYNSSVLRLASLPNLIIAWAKICLSSEQWMNLQRANDETIPIVDDELLLTEQLLDLFYEDLGKRNIKINLVSGTWGRSFLNVVDNLLKNTKQLLVLSSETIYQPENLNVIAETMIYYKQTYQASQILLSAKDIYFGVGGSVVEFERYLTSKNVSFQTFKVRAGLKRSIVIIN
ncbi:hypothetical protein KAFR_0J01520 [Kazachstania africana CBS 2517]|uniref:protein-histidine N-methyltransferase n=1 Tax=Kazachstania africana (strain ATCC 22294 / BCRC 22015 / CBS 2517 / CECT 1963 / NBRC 1671 / NRRL Y-8276) TaxID=1071382 RepID=H2B0R8_KAZAF|nr:hypothetical protein KAFR_0J01520 [Kazachstania africana CBS 2517]CCF60218.1 hypothetical protein KAFR_0J01520 [Kazachstania africana CBS 2517]